MGSLEALLALREAAMANQLADAEQGDTLVLGERTFPKGTVTAWKAPDAKAAFSLHALLTFLQWRNAKPIDYLKHARAVDVDRVPFNERDVGLP